MVRFFSVIGLLVLLVGCQTTAQQVTTQFDGDWVGKLVTQTPRSCRPKEDNINVRIEQGDFDLSYRGKSLSEPIYHNYNIEGGVGESAKGYISGSVYASSFFNMETVYKGNFTTAIDFKNYAANGTIVLNPPGDTKQSPGGLCIVKIYLAKAPYTIEDVMDTGTRANTTFAIDSTAKKLKDLKQLQKDGILSEQEFQMRKQVFLDSVYGINDTNTINVVQKLTRKTRQGQVSGRGGFGKYHALVVGINDYRHLPKLRTAINDAKVVSEVLSNQYGFDVEFLQNPTRSQIMDAFDRVAETLTPNDNLLIYYAGHGWLDPATKRGFWLPKDAAQNRRSRWISNATITDTLRAVQAKHVMVMADSCYSGTLNRSAKAEIKTPDYIKRIASKRARVVLTSGGLEPVSDGVGQHSPFAKALIDVLDQNDQILDGTELFSRMRIKVMKTAQQVPEYSDVNDAGHDGGDFIFVKQ